MRKLILFCLLFLASVAAFAQSYTGNITTSSSSCGVNTDRSAGACVVIPIAYNVGGVSVTIFGTFSGTLQFEGTAGAVASQSGWGSWSAWGGPSSATVAATYQFNVAGLTALRIRASAFASGVAQVAASEGPSPGYPNLWGSLNPSYYSGADGCAQAQTALASTIENVNGQDVDMQPFMSNGITCATPPAYPSSKLLLPLGQVWPGSPFILPGREHVVGRTIGYTQNAGSAIQANTSSWGGHGGWGGRNCTGGPYTAPALADACGSSGTPAYWVSGSTYYTGDEVTCTNVAGCGGTGTYIALGGPIPGNGFVSDDATHHSGPTSSFGPYYWTTTGSYPNPVMEIWPNHANDVEADVVEDVALGCQASSTTRTSGCGCFFNYTGQENNRLSNFKCRNPTVTGLLFFTPLTVNSGPWGPGVIGFDQVPASGNALPACNTENTAPGSSNAVYSTVNSLISATSIASSGGINLMTQTVGSTAGVYHGMVEDIVNGASTTHNTLANIAAGIADSTTNTHEYYIVWSVIDATHLAVLASANATSGDNCASSCGTANFFPIDMNLFFDSSGINSMPNRQNLMRAFDGLTLNDSNCHDSSGASFTTFTPLGANISLSGVSVTNSHDEGSRISWGIGVSGAVMNDVISNSLAATNVAVGVLIDNKFSVTDIEIDFLGSCKSGGLQNLYSVVDLINGNKLTYADACNVKKYWLDETGAAHIEGMIGTSVSPCTTTDIQNGLCSTGIHLYSFTAGTRTTVY